MWFVLADMQISDSTGISIGTAIAVLGMLYGLMRSLRSDISDQITENKVALTERIDTQIKSVGDAINRDHTHLTAEFERVSTDVREFSNALRSLETSVVRKEDFTQHDKRIGRLETGHTKLETLVNVEATAARVVARMTRNPNDSSPGFLGGGE